jgi:hypothetical protein
MKCKDCTVFGCQYRTTDAEKDCYYEQWTAKQFDWQSFRAEAAKDILAGIVAHSNISISSRDAERLTKLALTYTNELIRQLKEKEEK